MTLFGCLHAALDQTLGMQKEALSQAGGTPESAVPGQPDWANAAVYVASGVLVRD